jgi:NAD(P)-dependent dehydrogenase (short-subunit alcohol dehydrogenase family)
MLVDYSHCFVKTDVTSWDSQVNLFNKAVEFSPGGHVDVVVANAGIGESDGAMFIPSPSLGEGIEFVWHNILLG